MACQNCTEGKPCTGSQSTALVGASANRNLRPRQVVSPLVKRPYQTIRLGKLSDPVAAGVSIAQGAGVLGGGWGGMALSKMVSKKGWVQILGAAAGAYLGYQVVPQAADAAGV